MNRVLDAWAVLTYLQGEEPAASRVKDVLQEAADRQVTLFMSLMNVGEVFYTIGRRQGEDAAEETLAEVRQLALTIIAPDAKSPGTPKQSVMPNLARRATTYWATVCPDTNVPPTLRMH